MRHVNCTHLYLYVVESQYSWYYGKKTSRELHGIGIVKKWYRGAAVDSVLPPNTIGYCHRTRTYESTR